MIDTVRFLIPSTASLIHKLQKVAKISSTIDGNSGTLLLQYFSSVQDIGSYSRSISFFYSTSSDKLFLELSLPKFWNGHNVYLISPYEVDQALHKLYRLLHEKFEEFPPLNLWKVKRLDLCYAWRFSSQTEAVQAIQSLQALKYPRQKVYLYESSLLSVGSSYAVKFYLKQPEFMKHDYTPLEKLDSHMAMDIYNLSAGVLRFEVTLRAKYISDNWPWLKASQLNEFECLENLQYFLAKMINPDVETFSTREKTFNNLLKSYKNAKALRLFSFWILYYGSAQDRELVKSNLSRGMIYRNRQDLIMAKVGIPLSFSLPSLSIPSKHSVN